ncbi:FUSC family protein [Streptomyces sp. S.PB5]|uniref:FUSC family protein n=1 Tax=Streptomyces sp. S.PB5 TaxID=3020844 RepID=UPI0025B17904|nr:FUSC family protein [Streptomyces sp. S.PB5]MDN3028542.1 FUSC family protein [Streptomyces sp. S.PB5]
MTGSSTPRSRHRLPIPPAVRELLVVHPMPSRRRSATVAALCTAVPILVGQAVDQPVLGLLASTGALAALYGGRGTSRQEAAAVAGVGLVLAVGMALGSALAGHALLAVAGTALWAAVVAALFAAVPARPPGIVMPVLVCSVGSGLPPGHTAQRALGVAVVGALAAVLSWAAARFGAPGSPPEHADAGGPVLRLRLVLAAFPRSPFPWMAIRTGAAVGVAGVASLLCQVGRPYWAMAAAAAVLARGSHAASANTRAVLRGTGTAVGCLLAGALAATHPRGVTTAVLLAALTFVIELVVARNYAVAMVFVTPLSVLLVTSATGMSAVLTITADRLLETVLGCVAAAVAGQLVSRGWAVRHRRQAVADVLTASADLLQAPGEPRHRVALLQARNRLQLVSERTAGERRAVRTAASALDEVAASTLDLAGQVLDRPEALRPDAAGAARALRQLAARVDPGAGPDPETAASEPPPGLTSLRTALDEYAAR